MKEFIQIQNIIINTNKITEVNFSGNLLEEDNLFAANIHIWFEADQIRTFEYDDECNYLRDVNYIKGILLGEEKKEIPLDTRLDTLHIQRGLLITLNTYDINTVGDLLSHTKEDLLRLKSLGRTKWWYLKDFLGRYNLELKK